MALPPPTPPDLHDHPTPNPRFWQRPAGQKIFPLFTSLLFHAAIIALVIATASVIHEVIQTPKPPLAGGGEVIDPAPPQAPTGTDLAEATKGIEIDQAIDLPDREWQHATTPNPAELLTSETSMAGLIGIARPTVSTAGILGPEQTGSAPRPGRPDGSSVFRTGDNPEGTGVSSGETPRRIIFLCDASGSMMGPRMDLLRHELVEAISQLKPYQQFNVIFFQGEQALAANSHGLLRASPQNRAHAVQFVHNTFARGITQPMPAIRLAFQQQPDLLFLLTDGRLDESGMITTEQLLTDLDRLNRHRAVRLNTIAFVDPDPDYRQLLRDIAQEHGGTFRFVSEEELRRR